MLAGLLCHLRVSTATFSKLYRLGLRLKLISFGFEREASELKVFRIRESFTFGFRIRISTK